MTIGWTWRTTLLSCCVGALALTLIAPRPAEACDRIALTGLNNFTPLPAEGSEVPRTARVWIPLEDYGWEGAEDPMFELVDGAGAAVSFTSTKITVNGEVARHLVVLTPSALLTPGASYEARTPGGTVITRFTATTEEDHTPPMIDHVEGFGEGGEKSNSFSCGAPTAAWLHVQPQPEIAFMVGPEAVTALPSKAFAISSHGTDPMTGGLRMGTHEFRAVAVDVSGNFAVSDVVEVEISDSAFGMGCASAGSASSLLWALVPLMGAFAFRRRSPRA